MTPHAWIISAPGWALDGHRLRSALKIAPNAATNGRQHRLGAAATLRIVHFIGIRPLPARSLTPHLSSDRRRSIPSVDSGLGWTYQKPPLTLSPRRSSRRASWQCSGGIFAQFFQLGYLAFICRSASAAWAESLSSSATAASMAWAVRLTAGAPRGRALVPTVMPFCDISDTDCAEWIDVGDVGEGNTPDF